jgi:hypothetical protein
MNSVDLKNGGIPSSCPDGRLDRIANRRTAAWDEQFGLELTAAFYKIDRIHAFDVSRLGVIRHSMFIFSFLFDQTGRRRRPEAGLTPETLFAINQVVLLIFASCAEAAILEPEVTAY